mgnify:CR=1 FL=1
MDNAIRAITIGVSVLVAIVTISLVLTYYNTAKEGVSSLNSQSKLYENYDSYIRDIFLKENAYGTDVINLINYFEQNSAVKITINVGKTTYTPYEFKSIVKPNEKFKIVVDDSVTDIKITAID